MMVCRGLADELALEAPADEAAGSVAEVEAGKDAIAEPAVEVGVAEVGLAEVGLTLQLHFFGDRWL